jgi:hypothetical protein
VRLRVAVASLGALGAIASCASFRDQGLAPGAGDDGGGASDGAVAADAPPGSDSPGAEDAGGSGDAESSNDAITPPDDATGPLDAGDAGTCSEPTCPVTTLLANLYGPAAIATDGAYVYWLEVGMSIPQAGGEGQFVRVKKSATCADRSCVEVIDPYALSGTFEGQLIYDNVVTVNGANACYAQSYNSPSEHSIFCFPLASFDKVAIDQDHGEAIALWQDPASVLWAIASSTGAASDGAIRTRAIASNDGGTAPAVVAGRPNPSSVLSDQDGVVWAEIGVNDAGGSVLAVAPDGGVTKLATGRAGPTAIAEYGGYVYWIDADARRVSRAPRAGGGPIDLIAGTDPNPIALAVDATGVYWASAGVANPDGSVAHAPLVPGGPTTVMMTGVVGIQGIAVDSSRVWVAAIGGNVSGGGSIVSIAKTR